MEFIRWFTIAGFITGALFVVTDILADTFLIYQYMFNPPPTILNRQLFAKLTGTWVGLGGALQSGVAIFLTIKGKPDGLFKSLPIAIRILILVTSPILLSPVVLNIYGTYFVIRYGITDMVTMTIPMIVANLKFAEIVIESAPQLVTQWIALLFRSGFIVSLQELMKDPLWLFSIITS